MPTGEECIDDWRLRGDDAAKATRIGDSGTNLTSSDHQSMPLPSREDMAAAIAVGASVMAVCSTLAVWTSALLVYEKCIRSPRRRRAQIKWRAQIERRRLALREALQDDAVLLAGSKSNAAEGNSPFEAKETPKLAPKALNNQDLCADSDGAIATSKSRSRWGHLPLVRVLGVLFVGSLAVTAASSSRHRWGDIHTSEDLFWSPRGVDYSDMGEIPRRSDYTKQDGKPLHG